MLAYHQAKDIYHCCFRMLVVLNHNKEFVSQELLKIIDFYVVFPHLLQQVTLPKEMQKHKKVFKELRAPYENILSFKRVVFDLSGIQDNAIKFLLAREIVYFDESKTMVCLNSSRVTDELKLMLDKDFINSKWYSAMIDVFNSVPLYGDNGLKKRTGLLEYRYDAT